MFLPIKCHILLIYCVHLLLESLTISCPGVRLAPVLRLQRDAVRGAARRRGARHGRRHPGRLLPAPDSQEAPQCSRQQPKVR